jgi:hypothetical protein
LNFPPQSNHRLEPVDENTFSFILLGILPICGQTGQFVGLWDMRALVEKYFNEIKFQLLPVRNFQNFYDFQEATSLADFLNDFVHTKVRFVQKLFPSFTSPSSILLIIQHNREFWVSLH